MKNWKRDLVALSADPRTIWELQPAPTFTNNSNARVGMPLFTADEAEVLAEKVAEAILDHPEKARLTHCIDVKNAVRLLS